MKKTALVYDKWLSSLGGGEVVACSIAKILQDVGYEVTFVCGKKITYEIILSKLNIDLKGVKIVEIWNDEVALKKISKDKDLFINVSFIDYSLGFGKYNIYYAHFPTKAYENLLGILVSKIIFPLITIFLKPNEFLTNIDVPVIKVGRPAYLLKSNNKIAVSFLEVNEIYELEFEIFTENFYKTLLENLKWEVNNAQILEQKIKVNHFLNVIRVSLKFKAVSTTIYLSINANKLNVYAKNDDIYLLYPKVVLKKFPVISYRDFMEKVITRLRAGIFSDIIQRLKSYQLIFANSKFTKKWIHNYWGRSAEILYPPVDLLFKKYQINKIKKEKIICSVGRFFTLGHGKKQEILIKAFKKLYDSGYTNWQLHLVGGLGNEPTSIEFVKKLRSLTFGYPIYFYFNIDRQELEEIYLKSSIYWHAAGFGEDEKEKPIKFEHFGIAPIEAISAGCIPLLFRGGGLTEVINNLKLDGDVHLFKSQDELIEKTIYIINQGKYLIKWNDLAKELQIHFSFESFKSNFLKYLKFHT